MADKHIPQMFLKLESDGLIKETDVLNTQDGFWLVHKSIADILSERDILDFPNSAGERLLCSRFYDDWFMYAVPGESGYTYGLLKLREQEHDSRDGAPADGDAPGVTISFISFACEILLNCLADSSDANRMRLDNEINRVVARQGQHHHKDLKAYFINPAAEASYLVVATYIRHIALLAENGALNVPDRYREIIQQLLSGKGKAKLARIPEFSESVNREAGYTVCDNDKIYIKNPQEPSAYEAAAILATHTANTSLQSFAAEVEYHARFLLPFARIRIPFIGKSVYESAIRADMTIDDTEFEGPAPFYKPESKILSRQFALHNNKFGDK